MGAATLPVGSAEWLVEREERYGGWVWDVPVRRSSLDPRGEKTTGMGGDRMTKKKHGYAPLYAKYLAPFVQHPITLVEVGILRGTGLAIWCDLFPGGRIIGLDVDLSNFAGFLPELRERGAFQHTEPEVHRFDQFRATVAEAGATLAGDQPVVVIDDASHNMAASLRTFRAMRPHLAPGAIYIIEDIRDSADHMRVEFPEHEVRSHGRFTLVQL